jgi:hypothetical protein
MAGMAIKRAKRGMKIQVLFKKNPNPIFEKKDNNKQKA